MPATTAFSNVALGCPVPPFAAHAISVSLPTWRDNVGYEEGEKRVVDKMASGYPRFFIPLVVQKLANVCEQKYATHFEKCILVPSRRIAESCREFIERRSEVVLGRKCAARYVEERYLPYPHSGNDQNGQENGESLSLYIVLFHTDAVGISREFWQHTGLGVSSRFAEQFLSLLEGARQGNGIPKGNMASSGKGHCRRYSAQNLGCGRRSSLDTCNGNSNGNGKANGGKNDHDSLGADGTTYLEERYGRNLPLSVSASAKRALRRRLAGVLIKDLARDCAGEPYAGLSGAEVGPSSRAVKDLSEGDVYLYPTGMAAIWSAHQCLLGIGPEAKSVCFGFVYTDTLKILQKWGPGCYFYGVGLDNDFDELESWLARAREERPDERPVLALFTEFPSNPLLRSSNLPRLRALADEYGFVIVVDETIGSLVNVEVVQYADIVVSSLTKIFSGDANVMGGCLVLNPRGRYYATLKQHLESTYEDLYFDRDAIYLERNSRDFKQRVWRINANTEAVCDFLRSHSIAAGNPSSSEYPVIKDVFYPKYISPENYEQCRKKKVTVRSTADGTEEEEEEEEEGGYGGLFSLTFTSQAASEAFYDTLQVYKGPSLGTNFTLTCPYTILAHYNELDWAAGYGVEAGLVRVSVGMEDKEDLLERFGSALKAAEGFHVHSLEA
ncbi:hypothetical protein APHAL10511_005671 [Amanita phalloides]|nr:hypothetical protein APHAL10511_005671 [Amanita phalloides]